MKRILIAVFTFLGVHISLAHAQFVPPGASAAPRPTQPGNSGVSTRPTEVPAPSTQGQPTTSPGIVPQSPMSKETCETWFKQKKKEHEACAKS